MKNFLVLSAILLLASVTHHCQAQQMSYFDPAQAYNRMLLERGNTTTQRISSYKVIGTQYLMGEKQPGDLYTPTEVARNIRVSYNTYNQQLEFTTSENSDRPLSKDAETVDSFHLRPAGIPNFNEQLVFINGGILGTSPKAFYQRMFIGPKYSLYKKYKSVLGVVSSNYVDADLRQFDLEFEYYVRNEATHELKRLKQNESSIKKAFPQITNFDELFQEYPVAANSDQALMQVLNRVNFN